MNLIGIEFHPLAAQLDQRLFELSERLELLERHGLATERDFPVELDELIQRQAAATLHFGTLHFGTRAQSKLGSLTCPPRGQHYAEACLFEQQRFFDQEFVCADRVQIVSGWHGRLQALFDACAQARRLPQRRQQILAWMELTALERFRRTAFGTPRVGDGNKQALVAGGLQQIAHVPARITHF